MKKEKNLSDVHAHESVQVFGNNMFGTLRVLVTDNQKTVFCLADVCRALEINNPRQVKIRLEQGGVITADTPTTNQYGAVVMQPMTYIDEANLYRCIFQSRKAEAEKFQSWVFDEVLPQIRQTGGYIPTRNARTGEALTDSEVIEVANAIMQRTISRTNLPADDCVTTSDIALVLGLTTKDLNKQLVGMGVQFWNGGRYKLQEAYSRLGYGQDRSFHYYGLNGEKKERKYLVWTPQGKSFILSMFQS